VAKYREWFGTAIERNQVALGDFRKAGGTASSGMQTWLDAFSTGGSNALMEELIKAAEATNYTDEIKSITGDVGNIASDIRGMAEKFGI